MTVTAGSNSNSMENFRNRHIEMLLNMEPNLLKINSTSTSFLGILDIFRSAVLSNTYDLLFLEFRLDFQ